MKITPWPLLIESEDSYLLHFQYHEQKVKLFMQAMNKNFNVE